VAIATTLLDHLLIAAVAALLGGLLLARAWRGKKRLRSPAGVAGALLLVTGLAFLAFLLHAIWIGWD
jgi:hypothetical protein